MEYKPGHELTTGEEFDSNNCYFQQTVAATGTILQNIDDKLAL